MNALLFGNPDEDRDALRRELTKPEYQESLISRIQDLLDKIFGRLLGGADSLGGASRIVVLAIILALVVWLLVSVRRIVLTRGRARAIQTAQWHDVGLSPDQHLALAKAALESSDWDASVLSGFRASLGYGVTATGFTLGDGVTAREAVASLTPAYPSLHHELDRLIDALEAMLYGDQPATAQAARDAVALAETLSKTAPTGVVTPILERLAVPS